MSHKLLLADDSVTIQRVIELTFADEDVQVITVGDGQQAIDRIRSERPDIVLADVGMPERDGYEVASFVKNDPQLASIPVLLLTGAFEPVDEERAREAGCDGVLAKPFEPQMVITRVKELLASGQRPAIPIRRNAAEPAPRVPEADAPAAWDEATVMAPSAHGASIADKAETLAAALAEESPVADEEDDTIVAPAPEAVRIKRREPLSVPPPEPAVALDDYFDRLDAAFASLNAQPAAAPHAAPAVAIPDSAPSRPALSDFPAAGGYGSTLDDLDLDLEPPALTSRAERAVADLAPAPAAEQSPFMAQAFSALLAAERGEAPAPVPMPPPVAAPSSIPDDLIEQVVEQVMTRLTDRVVRETVADIISKAAERIVRAEIERIKASLK